MKEFYYIPSTVASDYYLPILKLITTARGASWDLNSDGIIIEPNSPAHIHAHLLDIPLLKGVWDDPVEV